MKVIIVLVSLFGIILSDNAKTNSNSCCSATTEPSANQNSDHLANFIKGSSYSLNKSANITIQAVKLNYQNNGQSIVSLDIENSDYEQG